MTNDKMTNAKALNYVLENCELPSEVAEKITNIKASIEKKNATKSDKPTKAQVENEALKAEILEAMVEGEKYSANDIIKSVEACAEMSTQKVSFLMRGLIADGKVEKTEDKRKSFYSLV